MTWEPTNANDVRLTVSVARRDDDGSNPRAGPELGSSASIVVDSFSIDSSGSLDPLHGLSNSEALGISQGNIEHEFSFTVMGEYYDLIENIRRDVADDSDDPRSIELFIVVQWQEYRTVLEGAYMEETNSSVSDGETAEHEFSGYALRRDPRQNNE
jgi:hypothetical protein